MLKIPLLTLLLAAGAVAAQADMLEISGFGGYTSLGMKQVNNLIASPKGQPGFDQTTTTDISNGYVVGVDVRTGALIPVPFLEVGLRGEYVGASNAGEAAGTYLGQPYKITEDPSMGDVMLGLDFGLPIPGGLNLGLSAYGGYGEGTVQQSSSLDGLVAPELYTGGAFVGELEAKVGMKLMSVLSLYAFGGMRFANLGTFADPRGDKLGAGTPNGATQVDFTGATGGLGLNFDF